MKRFYKASLLAAGMFLGVHTYAQETSTTYTLEQCIEYALVNSVNAQNAILDQQIASAKVKETIGLGLPQVNGNISLMNNNKLRKFFSTKQVGFGFTGMDPTDYPNFLPGVKDDDVIASTNFFQLKNSGDAGLSVNQLIFNGSYIVGLKAAHAYKDLSVKATNQTREQIIQSVMKAYYAVLINAERTDLFTNNIARVDSLLKSTKALNLNGFAEGIDVDRIQVTLNNLQSERDKFLDLNELGIELLKFQMNYPMDQSINVVGNIHDVKVETDLEAYRKDWDYKMRTDYQLLEANRRLQELSVKNQYAANLPVISANANVGYYTQSNTFSGLFSTGSDFSQVTPATNPRNAGADKWYGYSGVGLTLSMPIFSGLQRTYKLQQEKLKLAKVDNDFKSLKSGVDLEIKRASVQFENAVRTLASQQSNMDLASNVARVTKIKYEQGVGSNIEVVDAENSLRQSQTNYYGALFDAMVAKVDLDKAFGKLLPQYPIDNK